MRASKIFFRLLIAVVALMFLLLVALLLIPDTGRRMPSLPFDTNGYIVTTTFDVMSLHPPPHASLGLRLRFAYWRLSEKLHPYEPNPTNTTYAASPVVPCSIQGLLNECMQTSGTRYMMPLDVAAGSVHFGNAIALDGRQWIDSFESALQTNTPEWWDFKAKRRYYENLVLIRYPEQKTVLVLPASAAREFRRTNSTGIIDPPRP
jgi:hypothetical protein